MMITKASQNADKSAASKCADYSSFLPQHGLRFNFSMLLHIVVHAEVENISNLQPSGPSSKWFG